MKHLLKRIGFVAALTGVLLPAAAQTPIFSYDFEVESSFPTDFVTLSANGDTYTWSWYQLGLLYKYARCYNYGAVRDNDNFQYDDYMTTQVAYHLTPGVVYKLTYDAFYDDSDRSGDCSLSIGYTTDKDAPNSAATTLITSHSATNNPLTFINKNNYEDYPAYEKFFEVQTEGDYYFTFRAGGKWGASIDNIVLVQAGVAGAPGAVTNLIAIPAEDFSNMATINCVLPAETITGETLSSLSSLEIKRGEEIVHTATTGLTPGAAFSWTDNNAPAGQLTYTVTPYSNGNPGISSTVSTYVGPLTANPVTNPAIAEVDNHTFVVTWTAPAQSTTGINIDPALLKYNVYRVVDEVETLVGQNVTECTFTDSYTPASRGSLSYKIEALYGSMASAPTSTPVIRVGVCDLPFSESFASGTFNDITAEIVAGNKNWEIKSSSSYPTTGPQDDDGYFAYYNSYSASKEYAARLISPKLNTATATNAVLSFYVYGSNRNSTTHEMLYIDVKKDNGEWVVLEDATIDVQALPEAWNRFVIPIQSEIAGSESFEVALRIVSGYGYNTSIDNIKVFNELNNNLGVALTGGATIMAGNAVTYTAVVNNEVNTAVAGSDYSISFYVNDTLSTTMEGIDLEAYGNGTFAYTYTFNAAEEGDNEIKAVVNYTPDEYLANNESVVATIVTLSENPVAFDVNGTANEDGSIHLSWTAPIDYSAIIPIDIAESFVGVTNNDEHIYNGWKALDLDGAEASTIFGHKSSVWSVLDSSFSMYTPQPLDSNSKVIAVTTPNVKTTMPNDWLISPELTPCEDAIVSVELSIKANSGANMLAIAYSTTDDNPESFTRVSETQVPTPSGGGGTNYGTITADVPSTAKYIALNLYTHSSTGTIVAIRQIKLKTKLININGYNVYEDGERLNEEPVLETYYDVPAANTTARVARAADTRTFGISTIYDEGESALSEPITVSVNTGVTEVAKDTFVTVLPGAIKGSAAMQVYTLDGRLVASTSSASTIYVPAGVYVVRIADKGVKVIVK